MVYYQRNDEYQVPGTLIKLKSGNKGIIELNDETVKEYQKYIPDLNKLWLMEWQKYWIEVDKKESKKIKEIKIGQTKYEYWKNEGNKKVYTSLIPFENQIGKSEIFIAYKNGKEPIKIPIETVSKKLLPEDKTGNIDTNHILFYPRFFKLLVDEILQSLGRVIFQIDTSTFYSTSAEPYPTNLLFIYYFLKNKGSQIREAFNVVLQTPHRKNVTRSELVRIGEAKGISNDTLFSIISEPGNLIETEVGVIKVGSKSYTPARVVQTRNIETLDTPPNRFVKYFVNLLINDIEQLGKYKKDFQELQTEFIHLLNCSMFLEVADMTIFPASSTVLHYRNGYRELFQLYNEYLPARTPFSKLGEAIGSRNIPTLYEYFGLVWLLKNRNIRDFTVSSNQFGALSGVSDTREVKYQKGCQSYTGLSLRPDFTLELGGSKILFDAKFAFTETDGIEQNSGDTIDMGLEEISRTGRMPKSMDIVKMHAYKDAIPGAKAVIILYPGNKIMFYPDDRDGSEPIEDRFSKNFNLKKFLDNIKGKAGIGWIPCLPERKEGRCLN